MLAVEPGMMSSRPDTILGMAEHGGSTRPGSTRWSGMSVKIFEFCKVRKQADLRRHAGKAALLLC